MPNQAQQPAESKPKVKKAAPKEPRATAPKEPKAAAPKQTKAASPKPKADKPAKAAAPAKNAAVPKTPRKRTPADAIPSTNGALPTPSSVAHVDTSEVQILTEVSHEMIAVRAYFLAENRQNQGISGDHSSDWHEAEHQLRAEAAAIAASLNRTP